MTVQRLDEILKWSVAALLVLALAFAIVVIGGVREVEFGLVQGAIAAVGVLWAVRLWINPGLRVLWTPACWFVLAFMAYALWRYAEADVEYVARRELQRVLTYGLLFFLALNHLNSQRTVAWLTYGLIAFASLEAVYAILQFSTGSNWVLNFSRPACYDGRGSGTYICPNHLAGLLAIVLPMTVTQILNARLGIVARILSAYAALLILAGLGVTFSRGGWLAAFCGLIVTVAILFKRGYSRWLLVALVLLVTTGSWVTLKSLAAHRRWEQTLTSSNPEESANLRLLIWQAAGRMWLDHPWFGVGPGHFDERFPAYRPTRVRLRPGYVHNDYLNLLSDWGVVGSVLVCCFVVAIMHGLRPTLRYVSRAGTKFGVGSSNRFAFVLGASGGLAALGAHSAVDFNLQIPGNAMLAVTLVALLASHLRFTSQRFWINPRRFGKAVLTLYALAFAAYSLQQARVRLGEHRYLTLAETKGRSPDQKLADLRQAWKLEPRNPQTAYALGETFRIRSWQGMSGYEADALEAMPWFHRALALNRFDVYSSLRLGMCLDWLGQHAKALPFYATALQLDPNNYYLAAHMGWHYVQAADYRKALEWFDRSLTLNPWKNPVAKTYRPIVERLLQSDERKPKDMK